MFRIAFFKDALSHAMSISQRRAPERRQFIDQRLREKERERARESKKKDDSGRERERKMGRCEKVRVYVCVRER